MIINWNKNPLRTTVEPDVREMATLRQRILVEEFSDLLFGIHFNLAEGSHFDLERARRDADPSYYMSDEGPSDLERRVETLLEHYLIELALPHSGDCTCVPTSCGKCRAESLLGVDTIAGLGKHCAYKIEEAFGPDSSLSVEEALAGLAAYDPKPSGSWLSDVAGFAAHLPRWSAEAKAAHDWLLKYRDERFPIR